jgi:hypothetical protein
LPLSGKARIEAYLPDLPSPNYQELLEALQREFTFTFGGCTLIRDLDGSYLSQQGEWIQDRINLVYTDTPFSFEKKTLARYADRLRSAAFRALKEEAVLIAVYQVYHSE